MGGETLELKGFARGDDTLSDLALYGIAAAAITVLVGPLAGLFLGGPTGAAIAGASIVLAVLLWSFRKAGRTRWSLHIDGAAAELVLGPSVRDLRWREHRVIVPTREVCLSIDGERDPRLELWVHAAAIPATRLSFDDLQHARTVEAWLQRAKDSARSDV